MQHDPIVAVEDAIRACQLILEFTGGMKEAEYCADLKTKAAVEREFEIIGEAERIDNWKEIIGFRNVIAHSYDVVEDEIVWDSIQRNIPVLLEQLKNINK
ncbi:MAG: DUF86 domain-containing protein [Syntrophus sp. (in: bacteria)]|nr:DUF86 domain-containing protein [Syntrophus sp. (in: bacteria)]